jgi:hypothetical protein
MRHPVLTGRRARSAVLLLVTASTACSSQTTDLDGFDLFFRYEVNGTLVEYTTLRDVFGVFTFEDRGADILSIVGWDANSTLGLRVWSYRGTPGVGTHSIAQMANDSTFGIDIYYQDPDGIDHYAEPVVPEDATIVITHIGGSTIDGTFFGVVKAAGRPDVMITNGEFTVRRELDLYP